MTITFWVLTVYLLTVALSLPFLNKGVRDAYEETKHTVNIFSFFSPKFLSQFIAFIPILNVYIAFSEFMKWLALRAVSRRIRKMAKKYKGTETEADLNHVADLIRDLNSLKDKND